MAALQIGITVRSMDLTASQLAELARISEEGGFEYVTVTEELARSSFTCIAAAATATQRVRLATTIANIYGRTPLTIAMEALTLSELSNGRFELGLGAGGPGIIEKGHGVPFDRPVRRMREYIAIVKGLLSGERTSYGGQFFRVENIKLWATPPKANLPIYIAALNPGMLRLAGELADGAVLNMLPLKAIDRLTPFIQEGLDRAGRSRSDFKVMSMLLCGLGEEPKAVDELRRAVAFYCSAPSYQFLVKQSGFKEEASRVKAAWDCGRREEALSLVSEDMLAQLTLGYRAEDILARAEAYRQAGIYPLLYLQAPRGRAFEDCMKLVRALSRM